MESNVSVLLEHVDVESLSLLLRKSKDGKGLSRGESLSSEATLIGNGLKLDRLFSLSPRERMREYGKRGESSLDFTCSLTTHNLPER